MSKDLLDYVKKGVQSLSPYEPGRPIDEIKREYGLSEVIKLASNENPFGPSPHVQQAIADAAGQIALYPDGNGFVLKNVLAAEHDIDPSRITLGNGSNDVLCLLSQVFLGPGTNAVMSRYGFAVYSLAANGLDAEMIVAEAQASDSDMPYGHDPETLASAVNDNTRIVFIANPNNPTGTWLDADAIEGLIQRIPSHVLVVLDEAYREYLDPALRPDSRSWLDRYPNLVITRTFSKAYALAGMRVGYALSSPAIADRVNRVRQPFNVNSVGMVAAAAALSDRDHLDKTLKHNADELPRMQRELEALGCTALPSQTNFQIFDVGRHCRPVFQGLLEQGIIVRPMDGYGLPNQLRATIGTTEENNRLLAALPKALEKTA